MTSSPEGINAASAEGSWRRRVGMGGGGGSLESPTRHRAAPSMYAPTTSASVAPRADAAHARNALYDTSLHAAPTGNCGAAELALYTQRVRTIEDRLVTMERMVCAASAGVEDVRGRLDAELRSVELHRLAARDGEHQWGAAAARMQASIDRVAADVEALTRRIDARDASVAESLRVAMSRADAAGAAAVDAANRHAGASDATAARLQAEVGDVVTRALRAVQSHVRQSEHRTAADVTARLDTFEKERAALAGAVAGVSAMQADLHAAVAAAQADAARVDNATRRHAVAVAQLEEDVRVLQRRLVSALRHLAHDVGGDASSGGRSGAGIFGLGSGGASTFLSSSAAASPIAVAAHDETRRHDYGGSHRQNTSGGGASSGADATTGSAAFQGGDDVDAFLRELQGMTSMTLAQQQRGGRAAGDGE